MIDYTKIIERPELTLEVKKCFEYMQKHEINIFVLPIIQKIECQIRNNQQNQKMISDFGIKVLKEQKYFLTVEVEFETFHKIISSKTYDDYTDQGNNLKWSIENVLEQNGIDNSTELEVVSFVLHKMSEETSESKILIYELHSLFNQLCSKHFIAPLSKNENQRINLIYDLNLLNPTEREIIFKELFTTKKD